MSEIIEMFPPDEAGRLARNWLLEHDRKITPDDIIDAMDFAVTLVGAGFDDWHSSTEGEKEERAVLLGSLILARKFICELLEEDE